MNNSTIGADQKITVREHRSSIPEVHRLAYGFLSRNKVQPSDRSGIVRRVVPAPFLNGDEFHISELAKG